MVKITSIPCNKGNYGAQRNINTIKYIVVHYTANDGDFDTANAKYFQTAGRGASAHYFVDDDSITQSVADNYVAWSVGGSKWSDCNKTGGGKMYGKITNSNSISIEMCDTKKDGKVQATETTMSNTVDLIVSLLKKYNLKPDCVYRHFDVNGKHCPAYLMDSKAWTSFKNKITTSYNSKNTKTASTTTKTTTAAKTAITKYSQTQFIKDVCSILGVSTAKKALDKTITISKSKNKNHKLVTPLERYMKALGYYTGAIEADANKTPDFGGVMESAIKKYQKNVVKASTKNQDGEITAKATTWKKLLGLS